MIDLIACGYMKCTFAAGEGVREDSPARKMVLSVYPSSLQLEESP
jgi:hypothetical protein